MENVDFKNLVIFEFANNHMGDVEHGLRMVREFADVVNRVNLKELQFAIKFQFRDIETFIHPDFKSRNDLKYVKRFTETKLSNNEFFLLKSEAEKAGFKTICTGFDEASVELIREMRFDIIKVASCSFTDWPLLNKVVEVGLPVIASTAGSSLEEIDNVVSFFKNRNKDLAIMHCVGEYPTKEENLQLNQIDFLRERYQDVPIGFSTHEEPDNYLPIMAAIAKGASLFEKHVAVDTEQYPKNAYSSTPDEVENWLLSASRALKMCGKVDGRHESSEKEISDLRRFKRGVFVNKRVEKGEVIDRSNTFCAWPPQDGQILANDMSKYTHYIAQKTLEPRGAVNTQEVNKVSTREQVWDIVQDVKSFLQESNVVYPGQAKLEISHHYGVDKFYETGITMITVVNREYCKKLIIMLPNQNHPEQYHKQKEETFLVLHGEVDLYLNNNYQLLQKGDVITIEPGVRHHFSTKNGCVIEEVSSTHYKDDSYYTDNRIAENKNRKTFITHWME